MKKLQIVAILVFAIMLSVITPVFEAYGQVNAIESSVEALEGASRVEKLSDQGLVENPYAEPNNGLTSDFNVIIPVILGASALAMIVGGHKVYNRRRMSRRIEAESEIAEEVAEIFEKPEEPVIDRFVAEPIIRVQRKTVSVDSFIR